MNANRIFPWAVAVLGAAYLLYLMQPPKQDGPYMLNEFRQVPVLEGGRVKPIDTLARNSLLAISKRRTYRDEQGDSQPAIRWLLDVMSGSEAAHAHKVFRIENDQVLDMMGLKERPGLRYSVDELAPKIGELAQQAQLAHDVPDRKRNLYQVKVLELANQLQLYQQLVQWRQPLAVPPASPGGQWQSLGDLNAAAEQRAQARIRAAVQSGQLDPSTLSNAKLRERMASETAAALAEINPTAAGLAQMLSAYRNDDVARFNGALASYRVALKQQMPDTIAKAGFESFYNSFQPFYHAMVLYVGVFLLACFGWLTWRRPLHRSAFWLMAVILVVHTFALGARMYIQDRPFVFVTNLYSSAIFIGWGCVVLGLILEAIYRNGVATVIASIMGFLTLLIAVNLAADGNDTLEMMRAVLDTNFWLATHVTTVTLGYTATFVAGFLSIGFVLTGMFTKALDKDAVKMLGRMIYGVLCFALLLSFTGTVLGGIWADQSWGRFWGWDPKENGALMIVIWNALILHARWGGLVKQRGVAVLAIFGNIVTAWSWFGVNMLGVGLHSYGFMNSAAQWLIAFVVCQLVLIAIGVLPLPLWRSFAGQSDAKPRLAPGIATATATLIAAAALVATFVGMG